jgi:hypothetical protein
LRRNSCCRSPWCATPLGQSCDMKTSIGWETCVQMQEMTKQSKHDVCFTGSRWCFEKKPYMSQFPNVKLAQMVRTPNRAVRVRWGFKMT